MNLFNSPPTPTPILHLMLVLTLSWHQIQPATATTFAGKDVTSMLLAKNEEIFPMAYGDFNADKLTDVFAVSRDHSTIKIYFGHAEAPLLRLAIQCKILVDLTPNGYIGETARVDIIGITPGDFNGDSLMDVMVAFQRNNVDPYPNAEAFNRIEVFVLQGNGTNLQCKEDGDKPSKTIKMAQEPLMLDINADMVMDLFSDVNRTVRCTPHNTTTNQTDCSYERDKFLWIFEKGDLMSEAIPVNLTGAFKNHIHDQDPTAPLAYPHSSAFVDSDGDLSPELVFITERPSYMVNGTKKMYHVQYTVKHYDIDAESPREPTFTLIKSIIIDPQNTTEVVGQSTFLDLNHDGVLDQIIPTHSRIRSSHGDSVFYLLPGNTDDIIKLPVAFSADDQLGLGSCHFVTPFHGRKSDDTNYTRSIVVRPGDFNLDGYPDLIGVVSCNARGLLKQFPVIFENVPCEKPKNRASCEFPRTFKINFNDLIRYQNATLATFFDIHEDGLVDVLLVRDINSESKGPRQYGVFAVQNSPDYDANFMKVMVLSGNACPKCTDPGEIPYGSILPGAVIQYTMTTEAGDQEKSIAAQLQRTAFQAMDLPYVIFGIGQSPNFVETLKVSVYPTASIKRSHEWLQIIPNSQILVVPSPLDKDWMWKAKLYLTPSRARLYTFGVLLGFCGVIFIIVALLQYKEKREDRKERLEEAHRFHMM